MNNAPTVSAPLKADLIHERTAQHPFVLHLENPHHAYVLRRNRAERRFQRYGRNAVVFAALFLIVLVGNIFWQGASAFVQSRIALTVFLDRAVLDPNNQLPTTTEWSEEQRRALIRLPYQTVLMAALQQQLGDAARDANPRQLQNILSKEAVDELRQKVISNPVLLGEKITLRLKAASWVDMVMKGKIGRDAPAAQRPVSDAQLAWVDALDAAGKIRRTFNTTLFAEADSREPEQAGIKGALIGSLFTIFVCILLAFPLGVGAALYLEEFAPKNALTALIELSISNLAAVPSIVFGLLGLSVFLSVADMPRGSALVGGMTLALLVLPVIVVSSRNALKSVPPSIKDGAMAMGASRLQVALHHTIPCALPGIMTGTILSIARALGETAPLLMIGMVAFVADVPHTITDPATVLPVQIYLWSDSPELGFQERTSATILILLSVLLVMNALALWIRKNFEIKW